MAPPNLVRVEYVEDESWRKELCPDCGARLIGFASWKDHGPRHRWGTEWLAARIRAGRPGEIIRVSPGVLSSGSGVAPVEAVDDASWRAGVPA